MSKSVYLHLYKKEGIWSKCQRVSIYISIKKVGKWGKCQRVSFYIYIKNWGYGLNVKECLQINLYKKEGIWGKCQRESFYIIIKK